MAAGSGKPEMFLLQFICTGIDVIPTPFKSNIPSSNGGWSKAPSTHDVAATDIGVASRARKPSKTFSKKDLNWM